MDRETQIELILDLYERGAYRGRIAAPPALTAERQNPRCGDSLAIYVELAHDGSLRQARYEGRGCTLSVAAVERLLELCEGQPAERVLLDAERTLLVELGLEAASEGRKECALLGLRALEAALHNPN